MGAVHFDELFGLGGFLESGSVGSHGVAEGALTTPVAGEGGVVPLIGESGFGDVNGTASRATTVIGKRVDVLLLKVFIKARIAVIAQAGEVMETNIPTATVVGVVAGEHVEGR